MRAVSLKFSKALKNLFLPPCFYFEVKVLLVEFITKSQHDLNFWASEALCFYILWSYKKYSATSGLFSQQ